MTSLAIRSYRRRQNGRRAEATYTSGQIDVSVWADEIEADDKRWSEERGYRGR